MPGFKNSAEKRATDRRDLNALLEHRDILTGIEVLGPDDCPIALAQRGMVYPLDAIPMLPLPGCQHLPWCVCCYAGQPKGF